MRTNMPHRQPWYRQAAAAVPRYFALKSIGIPIFIAVFFAAYFLVLKNPVYPVTVMPFTLMDELIGFEPLAVPVYLSLWVYVSVAPAFLATRQELQAFTLGMAATCVTGLLIFWFWPTTVPPATIDWTLYPSVDFLKNIDASGNACPSLHVATAVFSGLWLAYLLKIFGAPLWVQTFNAAWCVAIAYSTVATRQHVAVDMWAGLALGAVAAWLSLHYLRRKRPADIENFTAT